MQKSMWNEIWLSYRLDATRLKLFREIFKGSERTYQVAVLASIFLFIAALIWFFVSHGDIRSTLAVIASEILMLFLMDQMKSRSFGQSFLFAGETHHRSSRYTLFKKNIEEKGIGPEQIKKHIGLLDSEIDLAASGSGNGRRVAAFGVPLLVGLMVGAATSIKNIDIVLVAFGISLGIFIIVYFFASTFRTQEESLRELKTFVNLYLVESCENQIQASHDESEIENQEASNTPETTEA